MIRIQLDEAEAERYLRLETQWEIAQALGVSQTTVGRDVAAIQDA
jgi:hypothetical protein